MAPVTIAVILEPLKRKSTIASTFSPFICHEVVRPDAMIIVFWMLSFKPAFSLSLSPSRGSLVPLHFPTLEWYHLHIWGCYFSWWSWFQLVLHPAWHFMWCILHIIYINRVITYSLVVLLSQFWTSRSVQFSSVAIVCDSLWPHELQRARPPCPSPTPRVHQNSCPLCRWCHPTISSSVVPFCSCLQSFPASGSFTMSQLFASGGQSIGFSALTSVLPMNTQDYSPLGWTGWISLQSKGLSRVFSNTTVQKHQFFGTQLSSQSNSHIHTWLLEKPYFE